MNRYTRWVPGFLAGVALLVALPSATMASNDTAEHTVETSYFEDEFILELCGISTFTTLTERSTYIALSDGTEMLHIVRTYVSDDPRLPIEKHALTGIASPDGDFAFIGKPIHLLAPDGGTKLVDAGLLVFDVNGDVTVRGPHPGMEADLAEYYCP